MHRVLKTVWHGTYFDGRRATRHPVTITVMATGLRLIKEDDAIVWWPYDQIRQTQGFFAGEQVRLERGQDIAEVLVVPDEGFLTAIQHIAPGARARFHDPARRSRRLKLTLLAACGVLVLGTVLYLWGIPAFADVVASRIPVSWEERLGEALLEQLTATSTRCADPERLKVLEQIVSTLTAPAPPAPYTFRITVLDEPFFNALAAPGGQIVLFHGLLVKAKTPEELAGVLAHEIQHVVGRHATKAIFRDMSMGALISALAGDAGGLASALRTAGALGGLRYSRGDEEAADREGMKMLQAARIDPAGMIDFFLTAKKETGDLPKAFTYLSTHPHTDDRIEALKRQAAQARYTPVRLLPNYPWGEIGKICDIQRRS